MIKQLRYFKPTLGESWAMVFLMLAGSLVVGFVTGFVMPDAPQWVTYTISMLFPFAYAFLKARNCETSGVAPVGLQAPRFGSLGCFLFVLLSALAMITLTIVIEPATSWIPMPDSVKALFEEMFYNTSLFDGILSTCILAPLCEETLCRGLMLRGMLQTKAPWKAIFWSAFLFAFMHMNPWQGIPALMIGILFGWLYYKTRSLWLTIFLHCLNNSISTFLTHRFPEIGIDAPLSELMSHTAYIITYAASFIVLALIIYIIHAKTVSSEIQTHS